MKKHHLHRAWLIIGVYGVLFAVFSGMEEIASGKYWKVILGLLLGYVIYKIIENKNLN